MTKIMPRIAPTCAPLLDVVRLEIGWQHVRRHDPGRLERRPEHRHRLAVCEELAVLLLDLFLVDSLLFVHGLGVPGPRRRQTAGDIGPTLLDIGALDLAPEMV